MISNDNVLHPKIGLFSESDSGASEVVGDSEDDEKELEHYSLQQKLDNELIKLDKRLEQKEAEMKRVAGGDTSVLKLHYGKKVQDLEHETILCRKRLNNLGAILQILIPHLMTKLKNYEGSPNSL